MAKMNLEFAFYTDHIKPVHLFQVYLTGWQKWIKSLHFIQYQIKLYNALLMITISEKNH